MEQKPLINVIITTYNSQRFELLKAAVQSVQNQTYGRENIRIILAINGPDLAHKKAVEDTYAGVKNITCLYTPRSNGPTALNNAIRHLTEGYMFILDDDDYLTTGYLEELGSHIDSDIDIVFGRTSEQKQDGSIDYDTYINRTLMNVGAGKRKLSAKESSLLFVHVGQLFNVQTVKTFEPFDETLNFTYDTVYMLTNFEHINGYIHVLSADGKEAYVIRKTNNSLCRPAKEREFTYWVSGRIKVVEKLTEVIFNAQNSEHLKVAINFNTSVAQSIYDFYLKLPLEGKMRALNYINACRSPFLDKAKFANQLNMQKNCIRLENDCKRLQQDVVALQNNRSFKLGRFLTFVPRKIRDAIRGKIWKK